MLYLDLKPGDIIEFQGVRIEMHDKSGKISRLAVTTEAETDIKKTRNGVSTLLRSRCAENPR